MVAPSNGPAVPHVELREVSKRFGGVGALRDVSLTIAQGEIHALVGENGAGKSTLGRVVAGVIRPDRGRILVDGREESFAAPRDALRIGVTTIAQEIALVPRLSALHNVFLGSESHRRGVIATRRLRARYEELTELAGFRIPPEAIVGNLRVADQQKVEILRALAREARLIVMDEPTAALAKDESEKLFEVMRSLRSHGTTVVYVSHFLDEVLALADTITVLKDGELVKSVPSASETAASLVAAMLGRSLDLTFPTKQVPAQDSPVVFRATDVCRGRMVRGVSLQVRRGEIVGLAGLVGSGRSEVARCIFGVDRLQAGGFEIDGRRVSIRSPREAIKHGIAMLPESRKEQGLLMGRPVGDNITLPHLTEVSRGGVVARRAEARRTNDLVERIDIRGFRPSAPVATLSGGNQQKVLFAKWLFREPRLLVADEPTRGVDVGAKQAIYELIVSLAASGMGVLLISSELEEVLGLAHRVLVMRNGEIVAEHDGVSVREEAVMHSAFATELQATA